MLKTLDRYIIKQFLGTFFFILVLIMAVAVVFDFSEKTEEFSKASATWKQIAFDYYFNFVLYYSNLFSGLLIFIAVLLFTSRLATRTEVIASLSSGVSFPRFLRPYFIAATFLTGLSYYMNVYVLPHANRTRLTFEKTYIWSPDHVDDTHILREIQPGTIAYFNSFDLRQRMGTRFGLERWENGALRSKLTSERATYDTITGKWQVTEYMIRDIPPETNDTSAASRFERIRRGELLDTLIALKPRDIGQRLENAGAMDRREIASFIAAEKARGGTHVAFYEVEQNQRTAYPFAIYVFTLIGVSIASRKVRGGTGVHLVLGVMLILIYEFAMKISTVAATNSDFNPMLAVWLPNIIFGSIGVWIYRTAPK